MANDLIFRCTVTIRIWERRDQVAKHPTVFSEGVVTLAVAPSHIDLANPCAICLIAYKASVDLVHQKVWQFDAVGVERLHGALWVNLVLLIVQPAFVGIEGSQKLSRALENNFFKESRLVVDTPAPHHMRDILLVKHKTLKKLVIVLVDSTMKILQVAENAAVELRLGKFSTTLFDFSLHDFSGRVPLAGLKDNRLHGSNFLSLSLSLCSWCLLCLHKF